VADMTELDQHCIPPCGAPVTQLEPPTSWKGPFISSLNPDHGPPEGGTTVVITVMNFTGATACHFVANPATFTVDSDTQITAISPPAS